MSKFLTLQAMDYAIYLLSGYGRDMQEVSFPGYRPGEPRIHVQGGQLTVVELLYVFGNVRDKIAGYSGQGPRRDYIPSQYEMVIQGLNRRVVKGSILRT